MNIEDLREFCLAQPGAAENAPWAESQYRNLITFTVAGKWFCLLDIENKFCQVKCDPALVDELQDKYAGIQPAWHMNKTHWIKIILDSDVPQSEIEALVRSAHRLIVTRLPKTQKAALGLA